MTTHQTFSAGGDADVGSVRYVGLGDSTTEGLYDPGAHQGWIGWSQRLAHRLARQHDEIQWANLAVRGMSCREILTSQLARAVALRPTHATVFGGMNDLLRVYQPVEDTIADLRTMLRTLAATGTLVATMTVPDLGQVVPIARPLRSRLDQLNDAIRALADEGIVVAELAASPLASDPRLWAEDRLHANPEGHRRIAALVAHSLGLPSESDRRREWLEDFDREPITWSRDDHREWRRDHLYPWLARRVRRQWSGEGVEPRHTDWIRVHASDDLDTIAALSSPRPALTPPARQPARRREAVPVAA